MLEYLPHFLARRLAAAGCLVVVTAALAGGATTYAFLRPARPSAPAVMPRCEDCPCDCPCARGKPCECVACECGRCPGLSKSAK